jgi:hypothetical protein
LVDSLRSEATEAVKLCTSLPASTPKLSYILSDIKMQGRLWSLSQSVNFPSGSKNCTAATWPSMWNTTDWQTTSWPVRLGVGPSFGVHDQILIFCLFTWIFLNSKAGCPIWQEEGPVICFAVNLCSKSLRTHNHTLLSHLWPAQLYPQAQGFFSVTSYNLQGLWCKCSKPPPHRIPTHTNCFGVEVKLWPMISEPVHLGVGHPFEDHD